jgi:hypothetical protein
MAAHVRHSALKLPIAASGNLVVVEIMDRAFVKSREIDLSKKLLWMTCSYQRCWINVGYFRNCRKGEQSQPKCIDCLSTER